MRKRFLYYLSNLPGINPRMLADRGLLSRFKTEHGGLIEYSVTACSNGPAGSGIIVAIGAQPSEYAPSLQVWHQYEKFWIGMEKDLYPRPEDLVREVGFSGYDITLVDGAEWRVPLLRRWNSAICGHVSALPKSMRPVDGRMREVVSPRYAAHDAVAERIWQSFLKEETVSLDQIFINCAELLAMNYRIGAEEVVALGLLDGETAKSLMGLAIDLPSIHARAMEMASEGIETYSPTFDEEPSNG